MDAAYTITPTGDFLAGELDTGDLGTPNTSTRGPPSALACRAFEQAGAAHGLSHLGRFTGNLLRPVPIGELRLEVTEDYVGRNAAHFSAQLLAADKVVARFTALLQRESEVPVPEGTPGHPLPGAPSAPAQCPSARMPFAGRQRGYGDLVENRVAAGRLFQGPCTAWFRLQHPLVAGEAPSPYQRVAVAADSGNGISAALDIARYSFVNSDLSIHLLRRPRGEWICLEARTALAGNGCGLAESVLYDEDGLIGRALQSLMVRPR